MPCEISLLERLITKVIENTVCVLFVRNSSISVHNNMTHSYIVC